jgi:hypothetical protein
MKRYLAALAAGALLAGWPFVSCGVLAQDAPAGWGTIKGQVIYGGSTIPTPMKIKVDKDQAHCLSKGDLYDETWAINKKNKGVRDVFLWLEDAGGNPLPIHPKLKDVPHKDAVIDQPCCQFIPHAQAMREGQTLLAKNSSAIVHNINYHGHPLVNPGNNFLMPPGSKIPIKGLKADKLPISVNCNIHGWMSAWVRVFDHPYYALTDKDGNFEIKLAPAGKYRLKIWHSTGWLGGTAGRNGMEITIRPDGTTDLGQLKIGGKKKS